MLVIARKVGQTVLLGEEIEVTISSIRGDQVRLAINAPRAVSIYRKETIEQVQQGNAAAVESTMELAGLLQELVELPPGEGSPAPPVNGVEPAASQGELP